jgi:L-fucose mutarotase
MLKGIDPLLSPDLLHILRAMGHGDELTIVDANYPAATNTTRLVRLDGVDAPRALKAVLSLMPLDDFVESPLAFMAVVGDPAATPEITCELHRIAEEAEGKALKTESIDRFDFYQRARRSYAIIATGERRLYGNVILKKGVIRSEEGKSGSFGP